MAAFRGYFDESGKENDPKLKDSACVVAGYVTHRDSWADTEKRWMGVLSQFNLPYMHMKEFAHSEKDTPFESWRGDEKRRAALINALTGVISNSDLFGVGAVIRLPDLRRFNEESGLSLNAYSFGMYACLCELSKKYPEATSRLCGIRLTSTKH